MVFADEFQPDDYSGYPTAQSEATWANLWDYESDVSAVKDDESANSTSFPS